MNKEDFLAQMKLLDRAVAGRGKEIADSASVSYPTYLNYRQGRGNDEEIMRNILAASRKIAQELKFHLNSINL